MDTPTAPMGLLTSSNQSGYKRFGKVLIRFKAIICSLCYIAGVIWFLLLAEPSFNHSTYFSENALLPGLVNSEMQMEQTNLALRLHDELEREREKHQNTVPTAWLMAKFRQIGLEAYTHNFTLNYPFNGGHTYRGKNIYAILRAPRIGSTEAIVISTPYRTPQSVHSVIMPSIPSMLAFASFARKQKYWAKDIIFVVTDQEQLGMQAWLEAYYGTNSQDTKGILNSGSLEARAGSIQAAINLELQSFDLRYINIKIEGLNGQLPNLDLVNLCQRLSLKMGIVSGHQQTEDSPRLGGVNSWEDNFQHLVAMVLAQSTGIPNGNHGLFFRYGVQAVTLEGHKRESTNQRYRTVGATAVLKLIESITRSLNNLLERFHQSFFFYLLVASDRYVSIGDYIPSLALFVAALLIKALITWHSVSHMLSLVVVDETGAVRNNDDHIKWNPNEKFEFLAVAKYIFVAHLFGVIAAYLPFFAPLNVVFHEYGIRTEIYLFFSLMVLSLASLTVPMLFSYNRANLELLHIATLLELGTALIIVGMLNISLALLLCALATPFALFVEPSSKGFRKRFTQALSYLYNPLTLLFIALIILTRWSIGGLSIYPLLQRSLTAAMDALTYSIVDSAIYGNWLYPLITLIFYPIWMQFFGILCIRSTSQDIQPKEKETKIKLN